jgi:hypothetical protein
MTTFTRGRVWALAAALALTASSCGWFSGDDDSTGADPSVTSQLDDQDGPTDDPADQDPVDDPTEPAPDCVAPALLPDQLGEVDALISSTVLTDFFSRRHDDGYIANQCWHDWTTDDCSAPGLGSTGLSYDFRHPCHRHDFGYRNFKRLGAASSTAIWNAANKFATDDQFLEDMREHCSSRPWYLKSQCLGWAQAYYYAVRAFG